MSALTTTDFIAEDWAFVGCPSRLGSIAPTGPVSGKKWAIPSTGTWIDADDAAELAETETEFWCPRQNCFISIHPVLYLNPDADQMARRPKDG